MMHVLAQRLARRADELGMTYRVESQGTDRSVLIVKVENGLEVIIDSPAKFNQLTREVSNGNDHR